MMESPPYLLEVGETSARDVEARIKREMDQVFPSRNVHVRVDDTLLGATVCVNPALPLPERWWLGPPALRVPPTRGW